MANVLVISKSDSADTVKEKVMEWSRVSSPVPKPFNAAKYTGRVKAYGDALVYQRKLRDEWN